MCSQTRLQHRERDRVIHVILTEEHDNVWNEVIRHNV